MITKDHSFPVFSLSVSLAVLASTSGVLISASYSTFCKFVDIHRVHDQVTFAPLTVDGRRPAYLCALPVLVIGSAGVASAQTVPSLLFWRFFQSIGGSPGSVLGAGVIGDIFKLEERGRAMGVFFAVSKLLFILASLPDFDRLGLSVGTQSRSFCWRYIFYFFRNTGMDTLDSHKMGFQVGPLITIHGESCRAS